MKTIFSFCVLFALLMGGEGIAAQQQPPANTAQRVVSGKVDIPNNMNFRDEVRSIVMEISRYAKARNPDFVVMTMGSPDLLVKSSQDSVWERRKISSNFPTSQALPLGAPWPTYLHSMDGIILDSAFCFRPTMADVRAAIGSISRDLPDEQKASEIERGKQQAVLNEMNRQLALASHLQKEGGFIFAVNRCADAQSASKADALMKENKIIGYTTRQERLAVLSTERPADENSDNILSLSQIRNFLPLIDLPIAGGESGLRQLRELNHDLLIIAPLLRTSVPITGQDIRVLKYKALGSRRLIFATLPVTVAQNTAFYWKTDWRSGNPAWLVTPGKRGDDMVVKFWDPAWKKMLGEAIEGIVNMGFDGVVLTDLDSYRVFEVMDPLLE